MSSSLVIDLFAEDRAHEEFLVPLIERVAEEANRPARVHPRAARGGHGKALNELRAYEIAVRKRQYGAARPDVLVAAIDANCATYSVKRDEVLAAAGDLRDICVPACPDPHIERWYLADRQSFHEIVGITPAVPASKCDRDFYKNLLADSVLRAGHPPTLGGVEFAGELVEAMDLYRARKAENSLKHFIDQLQSKLQQL